MRDAEASAARDAPGEKRVVPFNRVAVVGDELKYLAEAVEAFGRGGRSEGFITRCERRIESRLGGVRVVLTHSGTSALEMAALLSHCRPGDEFIMPSFTFPSTANAFVLRGGVPVFVDVKADNLNLDEELIEAAVTERTKGVVPVHYGGLPCALDRIKEIAARRNLLVIEDAAQAYLSCYRDRPLGTIGHMAALSFHKTKNITGGEGGALTLNDERLIERAEILSEKGTNRSRFLRGEAPEYSWVDLGSSFRPAELTAAFLWAQLNAADAITEARVSIFRRYLEGLTPLADAGRVRIPRPDPLDSCNGHLFYVITADRAERDRLLAFLGENGIAATWHFVPLHQSRAGKKFGRTCGPLTVTENAGSGLVRLPLYFGMSDEDVDYVVDRVLRFYRSFG